jgi:DNA-binding NarL/FixJ family response regulator
LTRVLLVAPIPALRLGLRALLDDSEIEIVGEADRLDSPDFLDAEADVLIYASASAPLPDLKMDGAVPYAKLQGTALLLLSDDPPGFQSLARSRAAWGALPLESSREELIAAIQALSQGLIVGTAQFFQPRSFGQMDSETVPLSERETEVLGLLAQGLANKQIAVALGITEHTIKFHVSSIYAKLNATNRAEAVRKGVRQGLIAI